MKQYQILTNFEFSYRDAIGREQFTAMAAGQYRVVPEAVAVKALKAGLVSETRQSMPIAFAGGGPNLAEFSLREVSYSNGYSHFAFTAPVRVSFKKPGSADGWGTGALGREHYRAGRVRWLPLAIYEAAERKGVAQLVPWNARSIPIQEGKEVVDLGWIEAPNWGRDRGNIADGGELLADVLDVIG
jgi:hypothetical protein